MATTRVVAGIGAVLVLAIGGGYYAVADCPFKVAIEVADELQCLTRSAYESERDALFQRILTGGVLTPDEYQRYWGIMGREERANRRNADIGRLHRKFIERPTRR